jgi:hypothetical protein
MKRLFVLFAVAALTIASAAQNYPKIFEILGCRLFPNPERSSIRGMH